MPDQPSAPLARESVRVPAEIGRLADLLDMVEAFGRAHVAPARRAAAPWHEFVTAIAEIAANILQYAYQGLPAGEVELTLAATADALEACFRDWGAPFVEPEPPPQPAALAGNVALAEDATLAEDAFDLAIFDLPEHGRGIPLARAALTSLDYERTPDGENRWRLVRAWPGE